MTEKSEKVEIGLRNTAGKNSVFSVLKSKKIDEQKKENEERGGGGRKEEENEKKGKQTLTFRTALTVASLPRHPRQNSTRKN